jgi:hypothetical protein
MRFPFVRSVCLAVMFLAAPSAWPQTTQPAVVDLVTLETRATLAFNSNDYTTALPLLKKLAGQMKDQPERLGMVIEKIRVCERKLAKPAPAPAASTTFDALPLPSVARKPHVVPAAGQVADLDLRELGNFDYDANNGGGNIPADVQALSDHLLRTRGFMMPLTEADHITEFALVPSLFVCCLGQPPQIQHTIIVHVPKGKTLSYFPDEIVVEGTLTVKERKDDGYVVSLFELGAKSIKPAVK